MSDPEGRQRDQTERANHLYWTSDSSVNQIAEDLGLSKGALYEVVEPLGAELPCPACGAEMAYPNRTARDKGFLTCPHCGHEENETTVRASAPPGDTRSPQVDSDGETGTMIRVTRIVEGEPSTRMLAGVALLGVAVGLFVGGVLRRR